ncbi:MULTISPECIES: hypothetical protein [Dickeya]|uniref:Uncharacterized protein n=1 Tax=Dickeya aquatica TaxID=1401087 RepID=A0A375ACU0_9GAMM|nr:MULTISPECIES: hypothetical protein [Dickeya]SLM63912.1 hypothetical protein DAQ1742_03082 [Dickeya aquatica]
MNTERADKQGSQTFSGLCLQTSSVWHNSHADAYSLTDWRITFYPALRSQTENYPA